MKENEKWAVATIAVTVTAFAIGYFAFGGGVTGARLALPLSLIIGVLVPLGKKISDIRTAKRQGFSVEDELSQMLNGRAAWVAFNVGNYFMLALMWYTFLSENFLGRPPLAVQPVLIAVMLFQIGVYGVVRFYYKGRPVR